MKFHRCSSPVCGRPFQINQFDAQLVNTAARGQITCPHCGLLVDGDTQSVFLTHALSAEQEYQFNSAHAMPDCCDAH
jgi:hypothetical protein